MQSRRCGEWRECLREDRGVHGRQAEQCMFLPSDILTSPPQLTILAQSAHPEAASAAAGFLSIDRRSKSQRYSGRWEQMPHGALRMSDLVLVGPPGPVHLTISGGSVGEALKQGVLPLDLLLGPIARWQINGWPTGWVLPLLVCVHAGVWVGIREGGFPFGGVFVRAPSGA